VGKVNPAAARPSIEHRKLIDDLGGPTEVVKMMHVRTGHKLTPQAVSNWRTRGIPFRYRAPLALEAGARHIGVPFDFLGEQIPPGQRRCRVKNEEVPFL